MSDRPPRGRTPRTPLEAAMARIPTPRAPRCLRHHVWMAGCPACTQQHTAQARQPAGAAQ